MEKKKKKKNLYDKLKILIIILLFVLIGESIYFGIKWYKNNQNTTYYTSANKTVEVNKGYITVGLSDYKHSKFNKYKNPGYNRPTIWIMNEDFKTIKEISLNLGYLGQFNDIVATEDGYLAIGAVEMTESQHEVGNTEGVLIEYDKNFKLISRKNIQILDTTTLTSIKETKDGGYIVSGSSLYEANMIGNHSTGGAFLIKYNKDLKEEWRVNHGGPYTGKFNDVIEVNDGYIAVGVKAKGTGIIFKYNLSGKELWHNYYGYTDSSGINAIEILDKDTVVVATTKLEEKDKTDTYSAAIVEYSIKDGKKIADKTYKKSSITRFEDLVVDKDFIVATGTYGKKKDEVLDAKSLMVKFDKELENKKETTFANSITTFKNIIISDDDYVVTGNTNSKNRKLKTNGKDYYKLVIEYDRDLD